MSTNKDDYNHLGLTDSEVLQSREKNGINPQASFFMETLS